MVRHLRIFILHLYLAAVLMLLLPFFEFFLLWYRIKRLYMPFWRTRASSVQWYLHFYFYEDISLGTLCKWCSFLTWLYHSGSWLVWWLELVIPCHVLGCSQIHSRLWVSDLTICTVFNPPLLQSSLPSVLSTGFQGFCINNSLVFVISRFYQQILLTPTSFLIALSMAGSVTVTCLPTL